MWENEKFTLICKHLKYALRSSVRTYAWEIHLIFYLVNTKIITTGTYLFLYERFFFFWLSPFHKRPQRGCYYFD